MPSSSVHLEQSPKPPPWRRWVGIVLRSVHLSSVVLLGAAILGATGPDLRWAPWAVLGTGAALFASELLDHRVRLGDAAGQVVLVKLAVVAWMAAWPPVATGLFWVLMGASAVMSHAPKPVRHWRWRR